ncbi:hypothetical protein [Pseudonocardia hierapolitana]|uniref:hypothetical protein n=1 Tax=Pseudonocardia hierapolitana TaxID=1128676 RepID=UPI0011BEED3E|nr:hypothetical protein [Pseudonocardia hierapolitana]
MGEHHPGRRARADRGVGVLRRRARGLRRRVDARVPQCLLALTFVLGGAGSRLRWMSGLALAVAAVLPLAAAVPAALIAKATRDQKAGQGIAGP